LLEAMVALVIVSLGMMAVNGQLNRYVVAAALVETKTLASWIATNQITALGVGHEWPEVGDSEAEVEFAGRQWHCAIVVSETDVQNLHRVDVSVSLADDPERVLHKVSGLLEPPAPPGFQPLEWSAPRSGGDGGDGGDSRDSVDSGDSGGRRDAGRARDAGEGRESRDGGDGGDGGDDGGGQ
jgi:general secretion pathway protein I